MPPDRELRLAAVRLAGNQLADWTLHRWLGLTAGAGSVVFYAWIAATSSRWWWAFVVLFTGFFAAQLWLPGHLRRRLTLLTADVGA